MISAENKKIIIVMTVIIIYSCVFCLQINFDEIFNKPIKSLDVNDTLQTNETKSDKLMLFTAIFSALTYENRRNAIRTTWLKDCKKHPKAVCKFIIDALDVEGQNITKRTKITKESNLNKDLIVLETYAGVNFGYRFYKLMKWVYERYDLDFLLRIDDDQYLCFDRLVYELPHRKKEIPIVWGFMHCVKSAVRIDEGFMIISRSLFDIFMEKYDTLVCHKLGDQAIALWLVEIQKSTNVTFFQDSRIYHEEASYSDEIKNTTNICNKYLSLHGTYHKEMKMFHEKFEEDYNKSYVITPITKKCTLSTKTFNFSYFKGRWFGTTKPCRDKPLWNKDKVFLSRERNQSVVV